jgi:hypothetical protein
MHRLSPLVLAVALTLLFAVPAAAGGWATVTLDKVPAELHTGTPRTLGFTILQHGVTPFTGSRSVIRARSASGQEVTFHARPDGAPGHYAVDVTFPTTGSWTWEVIPEPFAPQPLGTILVTSPAAGAGAASGAAAALAGTGSAGVGVIGAGPSAPGWPTIILRIALAIAILCAAAGFLLNVVGARRPAPASQ